MALNVRLRISPLNGQCHEMSFFKFRRSLPLVLNRNKRFAPVNTMLLKMLRNVI